MGEKFQRKTLPDDKARAWTFIVYPESAPLYWADRLQKMLVPCCFSPLHHGDEEESKEHYHVILSFSSPASAKKIITLLYTYELEKCVGGYSPAKVNYSMVQPVSELKHMIRYLCHLDQPDKEQFKWEQMTALNGMDIDYVLAPGFSKELDYCNEIIEFCEAEEVFYFYDLVNYARMYYFDTWFVYLKQNSYFIKEYLRSKGAKREYKQKQDLIKQEYLEKLEKGST